jgi:rhodanese-related sulfurtransferase
MKNFILYIALLLTSVSYSQNTLSKLLKKYNSEAIPYISVEELAGHKNEYILLDTREPKEYNVSHLKNAIYVGYDAFNMDSVNKQIQNKNDKIVVYCTIGIRSETIGIKLKKAGYPNVNNLFGGIFEWKNQNLQVYNISGNETENVHTYSQTWSKWLLKGNKVFD